jgi:hypothetical protein
LKSHPAPTCRTRSRSRARIASTRTHGDLATPLTEEHGMTEKHGMTDEHGAADKHGPRVQQARRFWSCSSCCSVPSGNTSDRATNDCATNDCIRSGRIAPCRQPETEDSELPHKCAQQPSSAFQPSSPRINLGNHSPINILKWQQRQSTVNILHYTFEQSNAFAAFAVRALHNALHTCCSAGLWDVLD